ncbi:MAG: right-handed parallel beta-helix repeat-containing protein [Kiritimatiellia bacterium]
MFKPILIAACLSTFPAWAGGSLWPEANSVVFSPHPHFHWPRPADAKLDDAHQIQIATDEGFSRLACEDRLAVVSRFVPVKALPPGRYWWRIRRADGQWSAGSAFEVRMPERRLTIRAGSDSAEVARVLEEAALNGPAIVDFDPGEYRLTAGKGGSVATLKRARDLIVDGHGARLILDGTFLTVLDSERVTLRDLHVTGARPGHTLVRILKVDAEAGELRVRAEPGYDADVSRFFGSQGFLNRVNPQSPGRHLGGFVTATATARAVPDEPGVFAVGPVDANALRRHEADGLATLTRYGEPFVVARQVRELTFSGLTLVDMPGAFCGGNENDAKSYLGCRVVPRNPSDFQGGHAAVGDGRVGEWIEGCEFRMLADDGPNVRTMRMKIERAEGADTLVLEHSWTNTDLRPDDTVALVHPTTFATATSRVVSVSSSRRPMSVQIAADVTEIARSIGITDWRGAFFYRVDPCCEDFVYRNNRHVGGRGHGVKYNGRRGWIADNHFEEITGNAIEVGYNWQDAYEGFGASEVLISGNTILRCGWSPISSDSKTSLAGRFIIRDNRIREVRDAAISLRNCEAVEITGNDFDSSTVPAKGAWIVTRDVRGLRTEGNRFEEGATEVKVHP